MLCPRGQKQLLRPFSSHFWKISSYLQQLRERYDLCAIHSLWIIVDHIRYLWEHITKASWRSHSMCFADIFSVYRRTFWTSLEFNHFYRPKRSFGQGNIFTSVCLSTGGGFFSKFGGGVCSKFSGGVSAPYLGGCLLQIFGGGVCSKFSGGSPIFGKQSTFGRYASYWNAFLFFLFLYLQLFLSQNTRIRTCRSCRTAGRCLVLTCRTRTFLKSCCSAVCSVSAALAPIVFKSGLNETNIVYCQSMVKTTVSAPNISHLYLLPHWITAVFCFSLTTCFVSFQDLDKVVIKLRKITCRLWKQYDFFSNPN